MPNSISPETNKPEGISKNLQLEFENLVESNDGMTTLLVDVRIEAWHYSRTKIERLTEEKARSTCGKFGIGTYFGLGDLSGESVDSLISNGAIKHEFEFQGNVLAMDREDINKIIDQLKKLKGLDSGGLKTSMRTGPVTDLVEDLEFAGHDIHAILVYMDKERQSAELVVLPSATDNLRILEQT